MTNINVIESISVLSLLAMTPGLAIQLAITYSKRKNNKK